MSAIETVLIGTSLKPASDQVVEVGVRVARAMGAELHLLHAFEVPFAARLPLDDRLYAEAVRRLDEQIERCGASSASRQIVLAPAHRALAEAARERKADLVVVGAADRLHAFGATASRLVRRSECGVLVVREPLPLPPVRVLMPVDLSPLAEEFVGRGLAILGQLGGASGATRIEVFHSIVGWELEDEPQSVERAEERARGELARLFISPPTGPRFAIDERIGFGIAREQILRRIEERHPSLVIMGTHGMSGFERFLVGSVTEGVVRHAAGNVLVLPPVGAAVVGEREGVESTSAHR
jgi:nucleotide-binding universal stress UspA family protein